MERMERGQYQHQQDNDDEDDEHLNIKVQKANYPVGWDGKPLPYWLYKLHGLGIEYKCEICGNQSYMGRKAFDRHFQENRHSFGLKCLGITNSRHFQDIVSISDALALWQKLKRDNETSAFRSEFEEEFEDASGNVFNRKTVEDLQRQGLWEQ
jgi:splicing factor 3A subunit 3